ncbi:OmpA family protein [Lacimicrobium alkaliphilum]|uniref:Porin n=1 Tax=Lacimicrobium alkaliphilum TaxID=1526571 RepID=A0ABQ1RPL4_9ALTE|nr:OmpA family protein [Lacimicrobium alkaliphilum]GGD73897.1 porin [Lacimicrobium alkaliphilum]
MKLHAIFSATALCILPTTLLSAQEQPVSSAWIGGFGEYYKVDNDKPQSIDNFEDASGFGAELGFRFTPEWGARLEWSRLNFDSESGLNDRTGERIGIDALHFFDQKHSYVFAGFKHQNLGTNYRMANVGIGRHWQLSQNWKVQTEAATYYDFGQNFLDFGVKLGLVYSFGGSLSPSVSNQTQTGLSSRTAQPSQPRADEYQGQATDSDNDGVNDGQDRCPETAARDKVDGFGCTIYDSETVSASLQVLFAHDSYTVLNPDSQQLHNFAEFMSNYSDTQVILEGHTSLVGAPDYNQILSEQRAEAVKALLVDKGLSADRIDTVGYGESRPLDTANTEQAHRINRRVEAKVSKTIKVKLTR